MPSNLQISPAPQIAVEIRGTDIRPVIFSFYPSENHTDFFTLLTALFSLFDAVLYCLSLTTLPTLRHDEPKYLICIISQSPKSQQLFLTDILRNIMTVGLWLFIASHRPRQVFPLHLLRVIFPPTCVSET